MAAYSSLVSLSQTLDTILAGELPISLIGHNLESLREKVSFLQQFLENSLRKTGDQAAAAHLEAKIRDVAFKAEDLIESCTSDIVPESETHVLVPKPEFKLLVPEPETNLLIPALPKPETRRYQDQDFLRAFLFLVLKNVVIYILAQILFNFVVKEFVSVAHRKVMLDSVQILMYVAFVLSLTYSVSKNAMEVRTRPASPRHSLSNDAVEVRTTPSPLLAVEENVKSVKIQYVQSNSEPEDEDLCKIIEMVGSIVQEVIKTMDGNGTDDQKQTRNLSPAGSSSVDDYSVGGGKNVVVGFESDLEKIRTRLTGASSKREIVSIVGMGGIGKTTLARQVFDDSYIVYHFDTRAWVTVSQEYSLRQVLIGLLDSANILTEKMYDKREEELADCLYKALSAEDDCNGSRVLLTTRLTDVALYADSFSPLHKMQFLTEGESWNLLCKKVFGGKDCPSELEDIGKAIAQNCGGLPLAIVVIGGLLSKESRRQEYWRSLAENLSSIVSKDDEQCLEILGLSYNRLPQRLRACFLYMAVFPEDYEIPVPKLIRLWAAEGFLKPVAFKSMEALAEEYLDDLIERNLILVSKWSANGKIRTCNIHDLLRNLCLRTAHKENFLYAVKYSNDVLKQGTGITPRRLSISPDFLSIQSEVLFQSKTHNSRAHSLLCTGARLIYTPRVYLGYRLLRVLDLIIVRFLHFPAEIAKLINLRYLAFTYNEALPPSIAELLNLQTLVYHNWTFGKCPFLPVEIWMMPKLRHLCVTPSGLPVPCYELLLGLGDLQTLSEVRNLRCSDGILGRISNLRELGISYDVSPTIEWSEYQLEALVNLHQLEKLKLLFKFSSHASKIVNPPVLAFPEKLRELTLAGCGIPWTSMTIVGELPNLEVLKLRRNACRGTNWEPVEGQFPQLKHLLLEEIDLVQWEANEAHFPRLQRLIMRACYKLKEIPSGVGEISTLQLIKLVDCHPSAVSSALRIQDEQDSMGNEELELYIDLRRFLKNKFYSRIIH
ncbi:UNVERIFIED_CONTAM: putative late blight resistance proteinR1A-10 [Sesamum radiatum]|uniref:Late blight resistance proteinR1A-10 n=1 Tax=Sesamum radiatum TaxID=300843 RepID=A0AAW2WI21_SESRA